MPQEAYPPNRSLGLSVVLVAVPTVVLFVVVVPPVVVLVVVVPPVVVLVVVVIRILRN